MLLTKYPHGVFFFIENTIYSISNSFIKKLVGLLKEKINKDSYGKKAILEVR